MRKIPEAPTTHFTKKKCFIWLNTGILHFWNLIVLSVLRKTQSGENLILGRCIGFDLKKILDKAKTLKIFA